MASNERWGRFQGPGYKPGPDLSPKEEFNRYRAEQRKNPDRSAVRRIIEGVIGAGLEAPGVIATPVRGAAGAVVGAADRGVGALAEFVDPTDAAAAPVAPAGSTPYVPRGITPEGQRMGPQVSGNETMPGVTGGASSTAIVPKLSDSMQRRKDFGFSFSDPNHVVDQAERDRSAFSSGSRTRFAGPQIQFAEDDARRPQQLAQQAHDMSMEDRARQQKVQDLLYTKQLAEAEARMGFETKYDVPYDPQTAQFTLKAEKAAAMDKDFREAVASIYASRDAGEYNDEPDPELMARDPKAALKAVRDAADAYAQDAIRDLALQWGVRNGAPEGYFRGLRRRDDLEG